MEIGLGRLANRAGAILCAALILVFTQAAVASAVGDVEHLFVGHHDHDHMLFSDITLEFHPSAHACTSHLICAAGEHAGHHHHHGDLGSSNLLLTTSPETAPERVVLSDPLWTALALTTIRLELPERPPRTGDIAA